MRALGFKVSDQELIRAPGRDSSNIIAGTLGYLQATFEFGQDWNGMVQVVVFYPYFQSQEAGRLIKDDTYVVPDKITAHGTFKIGVVGRRESGQRITTNLITTKQERGSGQAWQQQMKY